MHTSRVGENNLATAPLKIEKWSKAALVKWKAQKEAAILKHDERVKSLAEYHVRGASFNPTELKLAPGMPEADWMDVGRAVAHVYESAHFWLGDWIEYGRRAYGIVTAYDLAKQATGLSEGTLRCSARCARSYKPEQRHPSLSYMHHLQLIKYPTDTREKLLSEAEEIGLTTRQVRKAAEELHGKNEREDVLKRHLVSVYLWPETFERFRALAHSQQRSTNWFITRALEDWLRIKGHEDALKPELTTAERRARWEADGICIMCGTNEAWGDRKICRPCRDKANEKDRESGRCSNRRAALAESGLCIICGKCPPKEGRRQCESCLKDNRERAKLQRQASARVAANPF